MTRQTWVKVAALLLIGVSAISGCSSKVSRALQPQERELDTGGPITMHYHSALYYPTEISLKAEGYIVGVEKSPRNVVSSPGDMKVHGVEDAYLSQKSAASKLDESRVLYVSHVLENFPGERSVNNCALYNAYYRPGDKGYSPLTRFCNSQVPKAVPPEKAFVSSWSALDSLQNSMHEKLLKGGYTHIVVVVMGWNTVQEEAVRNFNSILLNMKKAGKDDFRPLFIGVTWPSQWNSPWVDPLYKLFSFPVKSADADELGMTWLGVLLHDTVYKANQNLGVHPALPVVVIGHSFGSRAVSIAACVGPVISRADAPIARHAVDTVINYQGAFKTTRLMHDDSDKGIALGQHCSYVKNFFMTASVHDEAVNQAFWGDYVGSGDSYRKYCDDSKTNMSCATADSQGNVKFNSRKSSAITYINADALIKLNSFFSGGGAHSDIYRAEHGALSWKLVSDPTLRSPQIVQSSASP
ncbi:alpha/beta hydrolase [Pseudomonas koreensis]|uniref:alpha/beta hydrolase n=1 Tax=Pseudomonas koreensis TaxID=198620 RepID=UPI0021C9C1F9|nr:alpha/beta hydrolase [Pseudomonas koreensis]MCU0092860.1 alpha/beta hydrolase [Pseudomonas koreensis]